MKTVLKSKINLIQKVLNFISIQWNYPQASPIPWDYPFNTLFSFFFSSASVHELIELPFIVENRSLHWMNSFFVRLHKFLYNNFCRKINCTVQSRRQQNFLFSQEITKDEKIKECCTVFHCWKQYLVNVLHIFTI
jgi:hypothetical protein